MHITWAGYESLGQVKHQGYFMLILDSKREAHLSHMSHQISNITGNSVNDMQGKTTQDERKIIDGCLRFKSDFNTNIRIIVLKL